MNEKGPTIKLQSTGYKEKMPRAARKKKKATYKRSKIKRASDFSVIIIVDVRKQQSNT